MTAYHRAVSDPISIVVTGGDGLIGRVLRASLSDRFEARFLSRADADLIDPPALERAFGGADAVVHLAANSSVAASWDELWGPNLVGTRNVYESAVRAGVSRLVFASSNHAVGMYLWDDERFADPERPIEVGTDAPLRPDSPYGASKAWGEALGRLYAERHGLRVICLRIGWVTADDGPPPVSIGSVPAEVTARGAGMWLSHRDCVSLVEAALVADVGFAIVHGVSDNAGRWLGLDEGRRSLGWMPADGLRERPR